MGNDKTGIFKFLAKFSIATLHKFGSTPLGGVISPIID
jgi:hypothetical protein